MRAALSAKVLAMASLIREVGETFFTLYKGFSVTFRTMFRKTTTESFPDAPPTVQARYRGIRKGAPASATIEKQPAL